MSVATSSRSQVMRQSLHLSIDPYQANQSNCLQLSPDSPYTSSSSTRPSSDTTSTSPSISPSDSVIFYVLCMHDYHSDDPVNLSFSKNEILGILKQESSGWWAAMRKDGDTIGWIPQAFVTPLSEEMTERLENVRQELRVYEYEAELLYVSAPVSRMPYEEPDPAPASSPPKRSPEAMQSSSRAIRQYPTSPVTPMPQPPLPSIHTRFSTNKPTPPTPKENETLISPQAVDRGTPSSITRRPLPPITSPSDSSTRNDGSISPDTSPVKRRDEKIRKLTGSDEALAFHNAVLVQAKPPWYLRARHADEINESDGRLISGTRIALVERLVWEPSPKDTRKAAQDTAYRRMFLSTFRTFMPADDLFAMLVDIYKMSPPDNLSETEFEEWRDRCLAPTRRLIMTIFTMWLEEQKMLEEEPHISRPLIEFLEQIRPPNPLATTAELLVQSITRLTFATNPSTTHSPIDSRKKQKSPKNELLSIQPSDLAEQLTLYEFKLYSRITAQDCINHVAPPVTAKAPIGCTKGREALASFCATHDKLAAWVTDTVLSNQFLPRRSDTVDFWIKVAEKCRNLNNFASMSAIINALSSTVISRLHITWAHVGRKATIDALLRYNEPTGGFSAYRQLHLQAEGSCVPFVGMYLTEMVHIKDQYSDEGDRVSMLQRQRWYEVVLIMLRSQSKPYKFAENDTMKYIQNNLRGMATTKDWQSKFWAKSQNISRLEFAHADIRRGLERAGF